jgi:hypothetical protein
MQRCPSHVCARCRLSGGQLERAAVAHRGSQRRHRQQLLRGVHQPGGLAGSRARGGAAHTPHGGGLAWVPAHVSADPLGPVRLQVGTESFPREFTSGDGRPAHRDFGPFYGSSYVAAPDGSRSCSLARHRDGVLLAELDLNLVRQTRDKWGFQMTARYELYAELMARFVRPDFKPQLVRDPAL